MDLAQLNGRDRRDGLLEGFSGPADNLLLPDHALRGLVGGIKPEWWRYAGCRHCDTDAWFPEPLANASPQAVRVCAGCPVRTSCLATAILSDDEGIWGGTRRGQRLHARARLVNDDPLPEVIADLLGSPMPATEYTVPDPTPPPAADVQDELADGWREAS